jgi:hypothetical protein
MMSIHESEVFKGVQYLVICALFVTVWNGWRQFSFHFLLFWLPTKILWVATSCFLHKNYEQCHYKFFFLFSFWFVFIKIYGRPNKQPWDNQALQTSGAFWIDNLWSITTLIFPRSKWTSIEISWIQIPPMWASMKNKNNIFQTSFPRPCKIILSTKS